VYGRIYQQVNYMYTWDPISQPGWTIKGHYYSLHITSKVHV
jgi:hypothetical protein